MSDAKQTAGDPKGESLGGGWTILTGLILVGLGALVVGFPKGGLGIGLGLLAVGTASIVVGGVLNAAEHVCRAIRETRSKE